MSTTPVVSLDGCVAKLRRAKRHFDEFDGLAQKFIDEVHPYRARPELDAKTGEVVFRLTEDVIQPPSAEWAPMIGDVAHNLMSALDHLVCQLSILYGGNAECSDTEFPIFDSKGGFDKHAKIGSLDASDCAVLRDLQPYQRGNDKHSDPLWSLRRINIIDKHRRLHLVTTSIYEKMAVGYQRNLLSMKNVTVTEGTKAGEEIIRFAPASLTIEQSELQFGPVITVTFGDPNGPLHGRSARSLFPDITTYIRDEVFPKFERRVGKLPAI